MFALPKAAWYEFQSPRRWGGGLGRSDDTSTASPGGIVSIPSEVGRGRARQAAITRVSIPRRRASSVIALRAYLRQRLMLISYANSHAQHDAEGHLRGS